MPKEKVQRLILGTLAAHHARNAPQQRKYANGGHRRGALRQDFGRKRGASSRSLWLGPGLGVLEAWHAACQAQFQNGAPDLGMQKFRIFFRVTQKICHTFNLPPTHIIPSSPYIFSLHSFKPIHLLSAFRNSYLHHSQNPQTPHFSIIP